VDGREWVARQQAGVLPKPFDPVGIHLLVVADQRQALQRGLRQERPAMRLPRRVMKKLRPRSTSASNCERRVFASRVPISLVFMSGPIWSEWSGLSNRAAEVPRF
jgi:hypothetical protein